MRIRRNHGRSRYARGPVRQAIRITLVAEDIEPILNMMDGIPVPDDEGQRIVELFQRRLRQFLADEVVQADWQAAREREAQAAQGLEVQQ